MGQIVRTVSDYSACEVLVLVSVIRNINIVILSVAKDLLFVCCCDPINALGTVD